MTKQDTSERVDEKPQNELDAHEITRRLQIGKYLDNERRKKGWTQTQLAKKAGCSQSMVSRVLTGQVHATPELLQELLGALELPLDSIDKLPGLGFDPGTPGLRLKLLIVRALVGSEIPTDGSVDSRHFIESQWDHPAYRSAERSANLDDAVWASLVADRYFHIDDDGRYIPVPLFFDLKGNLLLCVAAMVSAMSTVRNFPAKLRPKVMADVDSALQSWEESLDKPERLAASIDACGYALAGGDRMLLAALLGHASALKFFLEVGASVVAGQARHYSTVVMPFFQAVLEALQLARNRLVSEEADPMRDIMASLTKEIDAIFSDWHDKGMIPLPD